MGGTRMSGAHSRGLPPPTKSLFLQVAKGPTDFSLSLQWECGLPLNTHKTSSTMLTSLVGHTTLHSHYIRQVKLYVCYQESISQLVSRALWQGWQEIVTVGVFLTEFMKTVAIILHMMQSSFLVITPWQLPYCSHFTDEYLKLKVKWLTQDCKAYRDVAPASQNPPQLPWALIEGAAGDIQDTGP